MKVDRLLGKHFVNRSIERERVTHKSISRHTHTLKNKNACAGVCSHYVLRTLYACVHMSFNTSPDVVLSQCSFLNLSLLVKCEVKATLCEIPTSQRLSVGLLVENAIFPTRINIAIFSCQLVGAAPFRLAFFFSTADITWTGYPQPIH